MAHLKNRRSAVQEYFPYEVNQYYLEVGSNSFRSD